MKLTATKMEIITDGSTTIVDGTDYNLTIDQAAEELITGRSVICREYPDFSSDDMFECYGAPNYKMTPGEVQGYSKEEIIEYLRVYEAYSRA